MLYPALGTVGYGTVMAIGNWQPQWQRGPWCGTWALCESADKLSSLFSTLFSQLSFSGTHTQISIHRPYCPGEANRVQGHRACSGRRPSTDAVGILASRDDHPHHAQFTHTHTHTPHTAHHCKCSAVHKYAAHTYRYVYTRSSSLACLLACFVARLLACLLRHRRASEPGSASRFFRGGTSAKKLF